MEFVVYIIRCLQTVVNKHLKVRFVLEKLYVSFFISRTFRFADYTCGGCGMRTRRVVYVSAQGAYLFYWRQSVGMRQLPRHDTLLRHVEPLFTRTNRQAVQWRHVQRLSCAPPELGIEVWFQGDGRTEAHSLFRDALRTTSSDGRDADGSGGNGQLHTLSRTAEHGVCEDGAHGLHEAAGPRRQGMLGLSS